MLGRRRDALRRLDRCMVLIVMLCQKVRIELLARLELTIDHLEVALLLSLCILDQRGYLANLLLRCNHHALDREYGLSWDFTHDNLATSHQTEHESVIF